MQVHLHEFSVHILSDHKHYYRSEAEIRVTDAPSLVPVKRTKKKLFAYRSFCCSRGHAMNSQVHLLEYNFHRTQEYVLRDQALVGALNVTPRGGIVTMSADRNRGFSTQISTVLKLLIFRFQRSFNFPSAIEFMKCSRKP